MGLNIIPVLFKDGVDLPEETPIYKYLSVDKFLYLLTRQKLYIGKIKNWPDSFEGTKFDLLQRIHNSSSLALEDIFASCWTLERDYRGLYPSDSAYRKACEELERNGNAAMWETYCKNGGVRIKTTIGKLNSLLERYLNDDVIIYRGEVQYEALVDWNMSVNLVLPEGHPKEILGLFVKRTPFRYEREYRYIIISKGKDIKNLSLPIPDLYQFLDEILVCPATDTTELISDVLLDIGISVFSRRTEDRIFINRNQDGKIGCRRSQLYCLRSESIY